jgi:predicted DNA-binding transcriptional regulator AlpA
MSDVPTFMTPEQLSDFLQIPVSTLYRWRTERTGPPASKAGKHLRYRVDRVLAWLDELEG